MPKKRTPKTNTRSKSSGIYMPYKQQTRKPVKRKKQLFKLKNKKQNRRKNNNTAKILIILTASILTIGLIYLSVKFITKMRSSGDDNYEETYVVGLKNIPAYPNSEFIFEKNMNESSISNFISQGNSAYRLPSHTDIDEVYEFYNQKLPEKGWIQVLSVDIAEDDKKEGKYWIKDGTGLRLYSKFNDIWYETLTEDDAKTGLAERVKEEIEREMLLASSDAQDLLPDFPWILKIPKEYMIKYESGEFEDLRQASFQKIGGKEEVVITPIGYTGAKELDYFLEDYLNTFDNPNNGINNTILISNPGLRGTVRIDGGIHLVAVLPNDYNNVVYIVDSNSNESPFFEYILENITTQDSVKY